MRERLGLTPGTKVTVRAEDGKAVVEPEADPERVIERIEQLVEETSSERGATERLDAVADPIAGRHRSAVRTGTEKPSDE
ncbi:MAG: AbrB/MazE/SpoVT family DNA-binding domain-containing protein [Natrialbaceae archaeon]|nr:AbrB/MazE/SpoVT family DNA-binding domain-containing protein [Natrialbaceae archaeon]